MKIKIELKQESLISGEPGRVLVYSGEKLIKEIVATTESEQGADGKFYPCVKLKIK